MKKINFFFLIICLLSLCACGFHLRKGYAQLDVKYPIIYLPASGSHTFHQSLYRALIASKVQVLDIEPSNPAIPRLVVLSEHITPQPLVYGADGELRRERLKMLLIFGFTLNGITTVIELSTERERQLNSRQHLGDNAEKIVLEREMQADIIHQLLQFLAT